MEIRRYREDDCASLITLFRRTVRTVNRADYDDEQVWAWAPDEIDPEIFNGSLRSNFALVAEEDDLIVGFADMDDCGYLDRLFVSADCQRQGVGSELVERLEEYAHRIGASKITTEASVTALPFFLSKGYEITQPQDKLHNGVIFRNYKMCKILND